MVRKVTCLFPGFDTQPNENTMDSLSVNSTLEIFKALPPEMYFSKSVVLLLTQPCFLNEGSC